MEVTFQFYIYFFFGKCESKLFYNFETLFPLVQFSTEKKYDMFFRVIFFFHSEMLFPLSDIFDNMEIQKRT